MTPNPEPAERAQVCPFCRITLRARIQSYRKRTSSFGVMDQPAEIDVMLTDSETVKVCALHARFIRRPPTDPAPTAAESQSETETPISDAVYAELCNALESIEFRSKAYEDSHDAAWRRIENMEREAKQLRRDLATAKADASNLRSHLFDLIDGMKSNEGSTLELLQKANADLAETKSQLSGALATIERVKSERDDLRARLAESEATSKEAVMRMREQAETFGSQLAQVTADFQFHKENATKHHLVRLEVQRERDDLKARLEAADRQLADYRLESNQANEYIRKIGHLLGCADGDDMPEKRIAELRKDYERLDWMEKNHEQIERMAGKWWSVNIGEWSPSLRQAIDAAMSTTAPTEQ